MHMRFADDLAVPACLSDCLHHTLCFDHDNDPVPQIKPPFVPEQNINAAAQDSIGVFEDTKVRVAPEDQRRYEGWQTVDKHAVQAEFIEFLAWEQYNVRGWSGGGADDGAAWVQPIDPERCYNAVACMVVASCVVPRGPSRLAIPFAAADPFCS